jgi:hypothetical protein
LVKGYLDISGTLVETLPENLTVEKLIIKNTNREILIKKFPIYFNADHITGSIKDIRKIEGYKRYNISSY